MLKIKETNDIREVALEAQLSFVDAPLSDPNPKLRGERLEQPIITIGKPSFWTLNELIPTSNLKQLGFPSVFILARFVFSLRVLSSPVEQASLIVNLSSTQGTPTAFDLFPKDESSVKQNNLELTINPEIQFTDVVKFSGFSTNIVIENVQVTPIIQALGIGEAQPSWTFKNHPQYPLRGIRVVYMIIEKPAEVLSGVVTIDANATIKAKAGFLRTKLVTNRDTLSWSF